MVGKRPKLSKLQAEVVRVRYGMWLENHPKRICEEFGICRSTFQRYVRREQKAS